MAYIPVHCKRLIFLYVYIVPHYDLAGTFIYTAGHVNVFVESIITAFRVYGT